VTLRNDDTLPESCHVCTSTLLAGGGPGRRTSKVKSDAERPCLDRYVRTTYQQQTISVLTWYCQLGIDEIVVEELTLSLMSVVFLSG